MKKIVLAITGASAQQIASRSLQLLLENKFDVHLIMSKGSYQVWNSECNIKVPVDPSSQELFWRDRLNTKHGNLKCYKWNDNSSTIASGSVHTDGMVILPCTMGTLGRIASGFALDLIERCADVHLKENRQLIISPRESPFNLIHLRNMITLVESGARIIPCIPAWYTQPQTLDEMVDFMVVRLFDSLGFSLKPINRWQSN